MGLQISIYGTARRPRARVIAKRLEAGDLAEIFHLPTGEL
jgi:hypothetical protein